LLLASGAANSSGMVGRNLMDHPLILTWGLTAEPVWGFRGPLSTSGLEMFRDGPFRDRSSVLAGRHYLPDQLIGEQPRGDVLPIDWRAVRPMAPDPTAQDYAGTPAHAPLMAFNQAYTDLVDEVYRSFNGTPSALGEAVRIMYALKYQAVALLNTPSPLHAGQMLGPPFEYLHRG
jgi:hypothetical protein